jgi:5-formyltetrahydrofolate cyclo-ligase
MVLAARASEGDALLGASRWSWQHRSVQDRKAEMRRALLGRRAALTQQQGEEASRQIASAVSADSRWVAAKVVSAFIGVRGEPQLDALLEEALGAGKTVVLPRVRDRSRIDMAAIESLSELVSAPFGLREPPAESAAFDGSIDLALVPGLAFEAGGERIGFGAGYYDRWIASLGVRPWLVGVCFSSFLNPVEGPIPTAAHDQRMDAIVTELGMRVTRRAG